MKSNILLGAARCTVVLLVCLAVHYVSGCVESLSPCDAHPDLVLGWLPIVMAGISAAGSIFGGAMANKAARKQRRALENKQRRLDAWREEALGSDYLSRADSQAALRTVRENIDEQLKAADTSAIKGGMTDEARAAYASSIKGGMTDEARAAYASRLNRGYADVVSQIAGMGEKYRDRVRDIYRQESNAIDDALMNINTGAGAQNIATGIANAAGSLAMLAGGSAGRGATTTSVQPSDTVKNMASSGYLPNNQFLSNRYKINI